MRISILYFARLREATGSDGESVDLPAGIGTPRELMAWLAARDDRHAHAFAEPDKLRCAVDQVMTPLDAPLGDAREIAFFPPVTGG